MNVRFKKAGKGIVRLKRRQAAQLEVDGDGAGNSHFTHPMSRFVSKRAELIQECVVRGGTTLFPRHPLCWRGLSYFAGVMKLNVGEVKRSPFYQLINTITPCDHFFRARRDLWGSILVVGLTVGAVSLVRLLLAWAP